MAARRGVKPSFVAFDLVWLDGQLLVDRPYVERRLLLDTLGLPAVAVGVLVVPTFDGEDVALLFEVCDELGVEGVVLKRDSGRYQPGQRSRDWVKQEADLAGAPRAADPTSLLTTAVHHPVRVPSCDRKSRCGATYKQGPAGFLAFAESGGPLDPAVRVRILESDFDALKAYFTSGAEVPDPLDDVPRTISSPCLLIVGEDDFVFDGMVKCAQEVKDAVLVTLPNTEHMRGFFRAEPSLPHVEKFLAHVGA